MDLVFFENLLLSFLSHKATYFFLGFFSGLACGFWAAVKYENLKKPSQKVLIVCDTLGTDCSFRIKNKKVEFANCPHFIKGKCEKLGKKCFIFDKLS